MAFSDATVRWSLSSNTSWLWPLPSKPWVLNPDNAAALRCKLSPAPPPCQAGLLPPARLASALGRWGADRWHFHTLTVCSR